LLELEVKRKVTRVIPGKQSHEDNSYSSDGIMLLGKLPQDMTLINYIKLTPLLAER
jgi:hypothetical protein